MIKKWLTVIGKTILLLIGITFLSFLLVYHSPGDPAMVALKKSGMLIVQDGLALCAGGDAASSACLRVSTFMFEASCDLFFFYL